MSMNFHPPLDEVHDSFSLGLTFHPMVDGSVLTRRPKTAYLNNISHVTTLSCDLFINYTIYQAEKKKKKRGGETHAARV